MDDEYIQEYYDDKYTNNIVTISKNEPDILYKIKSLDNIPSNVIMKTLEILEVISSKNKKNVKKKNKDKRIFVCLFMAYNDLDMPVDPYYLCEKLNIDVFLINSAFKLNKIDIKVDPIKLSKFYINNLNEVCKTHILNVDYLIEKIEKIISVCSQNSSGKSLLHSTNVKIISIGSIFFYFKTYEEKLIKIYKNFFSKAWYSEIQCIRRYGNLIGYAYNFNENINNLSNIHLWYDDYLD